MTTLAAARHTRDMVGLWSTCRSVRQAHDYGTKKQPGFGWPLALLGLLFCLSCDRLPATEDTGRQRIELLQRRIKERPHDFIAQTMLGQAYLSQARQTGDLSIYKDAETAFQGALAEFPEDIAALAGVSSVRMAQHRFHEARSIAEHILRNTPRSSEGPLLLGDAQFALGETAEAARTWQPLPESPAIFWRRSQLARLRGDNEEALRFALRAAEEATARGESPENCAWYRVRAGEIFFRKGELALAEEQYRSALEQSPQSYDTAEHFAELRGAQERFEEAMKAYQDLIARLPRPDLEQALGDLYLFLHKPEQAKPWHDKALAGYLASMERGEIVFLHHLAGFFSDSREDGAEAVRWARKDLQLRATPFTHEALAWALYRAGDFVESRRELELALAGGIKDAHIYYHAGLIYSAAGNIQRGQKFLGEALRLNPRANGFHVHR